MLDEDAEEGRPIEKALQRRCITERERYNQLLDIWTHCREQVIGKLVEAEGRPRDAETGDDLDRGEGRLAVPQPGLPDVDSPPVATSARCSSSRACVV